MQARTTIDEHGNITIPAAIRQACGLRANDELIVEATGHGIILRRALDVPLEIYSDRRIAEFAHDEKAIGKSLPKSP